MTIDTSIYLACGCTIRPGDIREWCRDCQGALQPPPIGGTSTDWHKSLIRWGEANGRKNVLQQIEQAMENAEFQAVDRLSDGDFAAFAKFAEVWHALNEAAEIGQASPFKDLIDTAMSDLTGGEEPDSPFTLGEVPWNPEEDQS